MGHDPELNAPGASPAPRVVRLYELLVLVLLWNGAYKGARIVNTLYALELGAEPFDTGLLLATYGVVPLLLAVFTGRLGDRYGVRMPIGAGLVVTATGVALPFFWPAFGILFVAAAITGAGFILVQVSMQSLFGALGSGAARTRNINFYALVVSSADFAGAILAGVAIDHLGHVRSFLALGAMCFAAVLGMAYIYQRVPSAAPGAVVRERRRMVDLLRNRTLRRMLLAGAAVVAGVDLFQLFLPIYGHSIGLSASAIGITMGCFGAAGFVTRAMLPTLARRFGEVRTLLYSMTLGAATFLLIPLFETPIALGTVSFLLGLGLGLGQPLTVILAYNHAPSGRAGEGLGLRIAIINTSHVGVPALFGAVGSIMGTSPVFWVIAGVIALGGVAIREYA
jgi:predicted MFS family arabinose efflux permease